MSIGCWAVLGSMWSSPFLASVGERKRTVYIPSSCDVRNDPVTMWSSDVSPVVCVMSIELSCASGARFDGQNCRGGGSKSLLLCPNAAEASPHRHMVIDGRLYGKHYVNMK